MAGPAIVTIADWKDGGGTARYYQYLRIDPPTISGQNGVGWSATVDYGVHAVDLLDFCAFVGGTSRVVDLTGGGTATRIIPLSHPGASKLLATRIQAKVTGSYTPGNDDWLKQFSDAKVSVTFTSVPYLTDGSTPFMTVQTQGGSEEYSLAGTRLAFSDGTPVQADASLRVVTTQYQVTIYQCNTLGDDVIVPLTGTVNNASLTLGALACAAGTVRLDSFTSQITMTANFQPAFQRSLSLSYRAVAWNQFLRPSGLWDTPLKPDSSTVYAESDLSVLFA